MAVQTSSIWQRLADRGAARSSADSADSTKSADSADSKGIWDALREHLNPAVYHPVRSPDVSAFPLSTRQGQPYYILANRARSKYLRLAPDDHHLWTLMDGTRSVKDLIFEYFTTFGALAFDRVAQLVLHLRLERMFADPVLNVFTSVRRALGKRRGQSFGRSFAQVRQASIGAELRRKPGQRTAEFTSRLKTQKPGSS